MASCDKYFEQRPGVTWRCNAEPGHEGKCFYTCPCGYVVPLGTDGWHDQAKHVADKKALKALKKGNG